MVCRYEALRDWRKEIARDRKVESDIILPRDLMETLAHKAPMDKSQLKSLMLPLEWRFRTYGTEILKILAEHGK
jgi:ribonuclease D